MFHSEADFDLKGTDVLITGGQPGRPRYSFLLEDIIPGTDALCLANNLPVHITPRSASPGANPPHRR
jgi:hypothetical protein